MRLSITTADSIYISSVQVILSVTAFAKIFSAIGTDSILAVVDPIFGVSNRSLLIASGLLELSVVAYVYFCKSINTRKFLILWLASVFSLYRLGIWWTGLPKPCPCLGNLTNALNLSPHAADTIMKIVLAYIVLGSFGLFGYGFYAQHLSPLKGRLKT